MATAKMTAEVANAIDGICITPAEITKIADEHGGGTEFTVREILKMRITHGDAMFAVCRTEVISEDKLRAFAAEKAQDAITHATKDFGTHAIFQECVAAAKSGDAERMQEASRKVHRLSRQLIPSQPNNKLGSLAIRCIRACVHADAGEAALVTGAHAAERAGWVGGEQGLEDEKNDQRHRLGQIAG